MLHLIDIQNVSYIYRGKYQMVEALKNVNCTFDVGKLYVLKGPSGSGKTTLLSLLAGLDLPTTGNIYLNGMPYAKMDKDKLRRECVAIVFQTFNLFPLLTAEENVMFPLELTKKARQGLSKRAAELLKSVGVRDDQFRKFPNMLSGGEQQRVAIARALASDAKIILADEPTGNLDSDNGQIVLDIFKGLVARGEHCVIIVTHDTSIVAQADVVYNLKDGQLVEGGDAI